MIDKIYKYITGGYDKRVIPSVAFKVRSINPVEHFVKTKSISGRRNVSYCHFGLAPNYMKEFKIGSFEFITKKCSKYEIEYINQVEYAEIPNGLNIRSIKRIVDSLFKYGVEIKISNGLCMFIEGRHTEIYKRVWHCLEYHAYLKYPELFTDKI